MRPKSLSLLPFIAAAALAFGAVFVWIGVMAAMGGAPAYGVAIAAFGAVGMALAVGLWRAARRIASQDRARRAEAAADPHQRPTEER